MSGVLTDNSLYYSYSWVRGLHRSIVGRLRMEDGKVKMPSPANLMKPMCSSRRLAAASSWRAGTTILFNSWKTPKQIGWVKVDGNSLRIVDAAGGRRLPKEQ